MTEEKLARHVENVHAPGATVFACTFCGGCYGKQSTLDRHVASVHRQMLLGFVSCTIVVSTMLDLLVV